MHARTHAMRDARTLRRSGLSCVCAGKLALFVLPHWEDREHHQHHQQQQQEEEGEGEEEEEEGGGA